MRLVGVGTLADALVAGADGPARNLTAAPVEAYDPPEPLDDVPVVVLVEAFVIAGGEWRRVEKLDSRTVIVW